VARLFLDNFKNIQSSWVNTGEPYWAISSSIWCNDLGSTMMEENVVALWVTNL